MIRTPAERLDELQTFFRSHAPKKITSKRKRHIRTAANLQQIIEMSVIENAAGASHDVTLIKRFKAEMHAHLAAAHVKLPEESKQ